MVTYTTAYSTTSLNASAPDAICAPGTKYAKISCGTTWPAAIWTA